MHLSFVPPRRVKIGDAAAFAGTTPRAIRHYHAIGLLPEPERGGDGRRRYGHQDMIRLLWIRRMAGAGIALDDIRDALTADTGTAGDDRGDGDRGGGDVDGGDGGDGIALILERLENSLAAQEAVLRRQRTAVQRMRAEGSRMGLLSDVVTDRFKSLPEGALRQGELDTLLVTERIFGPLGAAVQATRFIALATHPALREESDRVDAAEEALDDTVAVDDPQVARVAAERHAFEGALDAFIEESGLAGDDDALFEAWDARDSATTDQEEDEEEEEDDDGGGDRGSGGRRTRTMSAFEAVGRMPYDFSPARLRCMELAEQLAAQDAPTA
ncbi:MerR family DNA-binding transcriptional regulator [Streptomyces sp. SID5594]|uniref:MerR family transcriptional regulator n=1 Tax=unclassified Streptomyces TaxID=2593676 RepID=UPI0003750AF6|nr:MULTISPECIES: MerR family transcriptional regulator [unclassified Streptomyces]MZF55562.1 MerR family DNA-binding transcriptional regulator [Streptomyces sp. SID5594]